VEKSFSVSLLIQKVLILSNRGSQKLPALWHFAEGLFYFYKYFFKKEGFLKIM
jgi:hypothetical protein